MKELSSIINALRARPDRGAALATIVKTEGSSYRRAGAHMLVFDNGETIGSISGGCLERDVIENALPICATGETKLLSYDTSSEEEVLFGTGLGCKGAIEILVEPLAPDSNASRFLSRVEQLHRDRRNDVIATIFRGESPGQRFLGIDAINDAAMAGDAREALRAGRSASCIHGSTEVFLEVIHAPAALFLFGAGFDAIPLARFAKDLGFEVTVIDRRPAYAAPERFPEADAVIVATPRDLESIPIDQRAAAVVMSHHYVSDRDYLKALLPRPLRYLGLMGPRRRAEKMLQEFREEGFLVSDDWLRKLHNPVGLDIGAEGPEQIALAILAEIQTAFSGHTGGRLREKKGPIHAPRAL